LNPDDSYDPFKGTLSVVMVSEDGKLRKEESGKKLVFDYPPPYSESRYATAIASGITDHDDFIAILLVIRIMMKSRGNSEIQLEAVELPLGEA
jgi:hypothetical protein